MLGGELAVLQAPMFDGLYLDPFTQFDDGRIPAGPGRLSIEHELHCAPKGAASPDERGRSAYQHCVGVAGVASSILATPTILLIEKQ